jgi:hypothetical protein
MTPHLTIAPLTELPDFVEPLYPDCPNARELRERLAELSGRDADAFCVGARVEIEDSELFVVIDGTHWNICAKSAGPEEVHAARKLHAQLAGQAADWDEDR